MGDGAVEVRAIPSDDRVERAKRHAPGLIFRFIDNDRTVVLGGGETVFVAWEVSSGKVLTPPPGHLDKVCQVALTPDGKHLLSLSEDGTLIRWDVTAGKPASDGGMSSADYAGWVGQAHTSRSGPPHLHTNRTFAHLLRTHRPRCQDQRARQLL
jgi:WD40 repeat protein